MKYIYSSFFFFLIFAQNVFAVSLFSFPNNLDKNNRQTILDYFAPSASANILGAPYPLGGYSGLEVGLSYHQLPSSLLSHLNTSPPSTDKDSFYPLLTVGKGFYLNTDVLVSLSPFVGLSALSHFSFQVRHEIWRSPSNIFRITGLAYGGSANLKDQLNLQTEGLDFIATATVKKASFYFGWGTYVASGLFLGGINGMTDSLINEKETKVGSRQILGFEWPIDNYFIAAEVNRMNLPYYSIKLGARL